MEWTEQFDIIENIIKKEFARNRRRYTLSALEKDLDVTRGKSSAWRRGQKPAADDLAKLAEIFDFSPTWLLTGEGQPLKSDTNRPIATHEPPDEYRTRYLDEKEKRLQAKEEMLEIKAQLADQQERIVRAVSQELRRANVDDAVIVRVLGAVMNYDTDNGERWPGEIEIGDAGARRAQKGE
jgi:transcriptional regulator with XRE-family HTH domain